MAASRVWLGSPNRGVEPSRAAVYGIAGDAKSVRAGACSTTRPAYMTRISSVRVATTPRSWETRIIAMRRSAWSVASRSRIWVCTVTSSPVVGSSASSSRGAQATAMAIATRWRMPPDSSPG